MRTCFLTNCRTIFQYSPVIAILFFFGMPVAKVINRVTYITIENGVFAALLLLENSLDVFWLRKTAETEVSGIVQRLFKRFCCSWVAKFRRLEQYESQELCLLRSYYARQEHQWRHPCNHHPLRRARMKMNAERCSTSSPCAPSPRSCDNARMFTVVILDVSPFAPPILIDEAFAPFSIVYARRNCLYGQFNR